MKLLKMFSKVAVSAVMVFAVAVACAQVVGTPATPVAPDQGGGEDLSPTDTTFSRAAIGTDNGRLESAHGSDDGSGFPSWIHGVWLNGGRMEGGHQLWFRKWEFNGTTAVLYGQKKVTRYEELADGKQGPPTEFSEPPKLKELTYDQVRTQSLSGFIESTDHVRQTLEMVSKDSGLSWQAGDDAHVSDLIAHEEDEPVDSQGSLHRLNTRPPVGRDVEFDKELRGVYLWARAEGDEDRLFYHDPNRGASGIAD